MKRAKQRPEFWKRMLFVRSLVDRGVEAILTATVGRTHLRTGIEALVLNDIRKQLRSNVTRDILWGRS